MIRYEGISNRSQMSPFEPHNWLSGCVLVTVNCKATTITPLLAAWLEVNAIANIKPCIVDPL